MKNHEFTKIYVQLRLPEAHGEPCATEEALGAGVREPVTSEEAQLAPRVLAHGFHAAHGRPVLHLGPCLVRAAYLRPATSNIITGQVERLWDMGSGLGAINYIEYVLRLSRLSHIVHILL